MILEPVDADARFRDESLRYRSAAAGRLDSLLSGPIKKLNFVGGVCARFFVVASERPPGRKNAALYSPRVDGDCVDGSDCAIFRKLQRD